MKIYTIRHAESVGNAQGAYSTKESDDLSPKGVLQAEGLSDGLDGLSFDHIFVSPTDRTLLTIAPYLKKKGKEAEVWPDLSEGCWHEEREPASETWKTVPASLNSELEPLFSFRNGEKGEARFPTDFWRWLCSGSEGCSGASSYGGGVRDDGTPCLPRSLY